MQITVYDDSSVTVYFDSGRLKIQTFGHRFASCGYQDGVAFYSDGVSVGCIRVSQRHAVGCVLYGLGTGIETDFYPFLFECLLNGIRYITVFAGNKLIASFEYGHFTAEACVHRGKLQADVAAAHNDQMAWQYVQFHQ